MLLTVGITRSSYLIMTWDNFKSIDFCLTSYCQAKCPSCPRTNENDPKLKKVDWLPLTHVDFKQWKHVLTGRDWSDTQFVFCGEHGDPMMHPKIDDFIMHGLDVANIVHIHTNGGIRTKEWYANAAHNYRNLFMTFSIDGLSQETSNGYRIGVDWQKAWDNMMSFHEVIKSDDRTGRMVWDYIVFEHNWHEIPEVVKIADDMDIRLRMKLNTGYWGRLENPEGYKLFEEYS